jgi:hypothetical protein
MPTQYLTGGMARRLESAGTFFGPSCCCFMRERGEAPGRVEAVGALRQATFLRSLLAPPTRQFLLPPTNDGEVNAAAPQISPISMHALIMVRVAMSRRTWIGDGIHFSLVKVFHRPIPGPRRWAAE